MAKSARLFRGPTIASMWAGDAARAMSAAPTSKTSAAQSIGAATEIASAEPCTSVRVTDNTIEGSSGAVSRRSARAGPPDARKSDAAANENKIPSGEVRPTTVGNDNVSCAPRS